ncbi:hypothetical protein BDR07DRAFT_1380625 [Suillus spraguei]|nr:hypothetical protein BDR07DRAFT_1380625 [Suillus spraguei]
MHHSYRSTKNAIEESIQEEEQQRDHERLQAAQHAKNNDIVYACIKDGIKPIVYKFQQGFTFPNFFFSHNVLQKLNILSEDTVQVPPMQQYNCVLDTWMCFDVSHMVTLHDHDGGTLLVKNACIKDCIDLGCHLQKLTNPSSPNIVKALPAKHKYMRAASHAKSSPPPSPSINPSMHDHVGPVPTIHEAQQNHSGSVLLLTDSKGTGTAAQLNHGSSILSHTDGPIIKEESSGNLLLHGTLKADAIEVEEVAI